MPIVVIDKFQVNSPDPVDSRMVATSSAVRESITYKYDGLKVFQTDDRLTYVWNETSATWSIDTTGNVSGSGTAGYIPKWDDTTIIGDSMIYTQDISGNLGRVGINATSSNLYSVFQINSDVGSSEPITFDKSTINTIGDNWYNNSGDKAFDYTKGGNKIEFDAGQIKFYNRAPGTTQSTLSRNLTIGTLSVIVDNGFSIGSITYSSSGYTASVDDFFIYMDESNTLNLPEISNVGEGKIYVVNVSQSAGLEEFNVNRTGSTDTIYYDGSLDNSKKLTSGSSYIIRSRSTTWYISRLFDNNVLELGKDFTTDDERNSLLKLYVSNPSYHGSDPYSTIDFIGYTLTGGVTLSSIKTINQGNTGKISLDIADSTSTLKNVMDVSTGTMSLFSGNVSITDYYVSPTIPMSINRSQGLHFTGSFTWAGSNDEYTLDDYQEGTWTPEFTGLSVGSTHTVQYGRFTKIGRFLYCFGWVQINSTGAVVDPTYMQLTGHPFNLINTSGFSVISCVGNWSANSTSYATNTNSRYYGGSGTGAGGSTTYQGPVILDIASGYKRLYLGSEYVNPASGALSNSYVISFEFKLMSGLS